MVVLDSQQTETAINLLPTFPSFFQCLPSTPTHPQPPAYAFAPFSSLFALSPSKGS